MNALIQELARESHIDVYGLGKDRAKWEACLEKFAELIVRECTLQCVHNEDMSLIEKHFGVDDERTH